MRLAVCFTNFGPYHLARLRALAAELAERGGELIAYEMAGSERTWPWERQDGHEPFRRVTLFSDRVLETISPADCRKALTDCLDRDRPDALGLVGYVRPESLAGARWGRRSGCPVFLMSESQSIDRPHTWWKELIKKRRVACFDAALVGGPSHRDYLIELGMPADRIALGYNAVDNAFFADRTREARGRGDRPAGLPNAPYFLSVCRFAPEKNLIRLIESFSCYRQQATGHQPWDLVLVGGGPQAGEIESAIARSGCPEAIHRPGFLQADQLPNWYAHASAFVLASICEPWGLVANEAAGAQLPLLLSSRAGCSATLVPDSDKPTGARFDPFEGEDITAKLCWMAGLSPDERRAMGHRAFEVVQEWGPRRFALGALEAVELAKSRLVASQH
ncbi:MAG: glycosyl transferase family 1 [Planctomycetes bacterium SCN 63-9]|nr:MAG: glycosyl transferase family 1 [Planctomycetes bacterium SCN 63-9]